MRHILRRLWDDDQGVIEAIEFLLTAAIVAFGLVVGLTYVRNALTAELEQLANAILSINFSYSAGGLSGCCASVQGSQFIQIPLSAPPAVCTPPIPSVSPVTFPCP